MKIQRFDGIAVHRVFKLTQIGFSLRKERRLVADGAVRQQLADNAILADVGRINIAFPCRIDRSDAGLVHTFAAAHAIQPRTEIGDIPSPLDALLIAAVTHLAVARIICPHEVDCPRVAVRVIRPMIVAVETLRD